MAELTRSAPRLIVFTDTSRAEPVTLLARFAELARRAQAGSVLFFLRDYALSARQRWDLGIAISTLAARHEQRFGVADRADLARALSASAFHLPESGLSARDARRYLGPAVFLSRACHELDGETENDLDARLLSPIFEARKGRPALGLTALERAARAAPHLAYYALGAVEAHNAATCLTAHAAGVAVIGAALAADPTPLLAALQITRT